MQRTLIQNTIEKVGETVTIQGWVQSIRSHGKVSFADIRDRSGLLQVVSDDVFAKKLGTEYVVEITGVIKDRTERYFNEKLLTGKIEMEVTKFEVLNETHDLPIPIDTDGKEIGEDARLRYRYLDLRRDRLQRVMRLRSDYTRAMREALYARDFVEVETPMLTKSTKEGSRDFVVPSRLNPGKFYALPQSPQQYKQLLMTAGVERYFQFARAIRDEDPRADRGFEHTQVDLEISFTDRDSNMTLIESVVKESVKAVGGTLKFEKFPVVTYQEAMETYGADKFDMRTEEEKEAGVLAFAWVVDFPFFKKVDTGDAAEVADGKSGWTFTHNPFSMPKPEHLAWHMKGENVEQILTTQYDLVCNGYEAGGGSIRAHTADILIATYKIMGYSDEEIEDGVGHMLEAFRLGTPPHGGIALGLDRHIMVLANETSLKEAIAFPMTGTGKTAVMDAPGPIDEGLLEELGISLHQPLKIEG